MELGAQIWTSDRFSKVFSIFSTSGTSMLPGRSLSVVFVGTNILQTMLYIVVRSQVVREIHQICRVFFPKHFSLPQSAPNVLKTSEIDSWYNFNEKLYSSFFSQTFFFIEKNNFEKSRKKNPKIFDFIMAKIILSFNILNAKIIFAIIKNRKFWDFFSDFFENYFFR